MTERPVDPTETAMGENQIPTIPPDSCHRHHMERCDPVEEMPSKIAARLKTRSSPVCSSRERNTDIPTTTKCAARRLPLASRRYTASQNSYHFGSDSNNYLPGCWKAVRTHSAGRGRPIYCALVYRSVPPVGVEVDCTEYIIPQSFDQSWRPKAFSTVPYKEVWLGVYVASSTVP